jgi:hypothetical protein
MLDPQTALTSHSKKNKIGSILSERRLTTTFLSFLFLKIIMIVLKAPLYSTTNAIK